jgi:hypothetical protein
MPEAMRTHTFSEELSCRQTTSGKNENAARDVPQVVQPAEGFIIESPGGF